MGFGYVLLQPGSNDASTQAAQDYRDGNAFTFMTKGLLATLHPVCFGARKCHGNEVRLHSHLGECFAGDYAIKKMKHYVFGQRFVWVTDCYAVKFLLSNEGGNPAILRLQMRLMCWDVDIVHRPDSEMVNADYWSHLGANIDFDPLFRDYLDYMAKLQKSNPAPADLTMRLENMPYYRGPRVRPVTKTSNSKDALHIQSLLTDIIMLNGTGHTHVSNISVRFGHKATALRHPGQPRALLNLEFASYAFQAMSFSWVVFLFSNGHFFPRSKLCICHFMLAWLALHLRQAVHSLQSLHPVQRCSAVATLSSSTFGIGLNFGRTWLPHQFVLFLNKQDYSNFLETAT
jgi:hypothetical protein